MEQSQISILRISKLCAILLDILEFELQSRYSDHGPGLMLSMERLYNLLGWEQVPGSREELKVLRVWLDELAKNKGEDWIRRHRFMLRDQWRYFLKHGVEKLGKPPTDE